MKKFLTGLLVVVNIGAVLALLGAYLATHLSPVNYSYLYFLGLGYPYILWTNIAFLVLWFFSNKKLMLLSGLTILLGFNHLRHFYTINFGSTEFDNAITVVSYNVHIFNLYNVDDRISVRDDCFNFLDSINGSIYCFQEFYDQENASNFETKSILMEKLNVDYVHKGYTHEMTGKKFFGLATFSKFPILNKGEIPFDNDANNFCIFSDVVIGEDTLRVYNAHLGSIRFQDDDYQIFGDDNGPNAYLKKEEGQRILSRLKLAFEKRAVQAEKVSNHVESSPYKTIVCMDLNDTPVSYAYRQFSSLLNDAFLSSGNGAGKTYIGKMPSNRIDYIFHSETIESTNFNTHQVEFSDHKPISCEIALP